MLYFAHLIGLFLVGVISLLAAWWVHQQTRDRAGTVMVVLLGGHGVIALLTLVQLLGTSMAWQVLWYRLWYLAGTSLPVVWFLLAVYYTGREHWLSKPIWAVLLAVPAVAVTLWISDFALESEPFERVVPEFSGL